MSMEVLDEKKNSWGQKLALGGIIALLQEEDETGIAPMRRSSIEDCVHTGRVTDVPCIEV